VLGVAEFPVVASVVKRLGFKLGVSRFVAGEDLPHALDAIRKLEQQGFGGILDLLGEFVATEAGASAITEEIVRTLGRLETEQIDRYMSIKPTQLGLAVSYDLGLANARRVAKRAQEIGAHICLDMESAEYVDGTLRMLRTLHDEGYTGVSTVLQSYLYRTMDDLKALLTYNPHQTLRLVKGAYRESPTIAYPNKTDVDANYRALMYYGLDHGAKINIATHDETITNEAEAYVRQHGLDASRYEFQLLYGVKLSLQKALLARGHTVRIYVPYGEDWYGYFTRRLAERPANLLFVVKGLFG
jgi:proline dehydrogenase